MSESPFSSSWYRVAELRPRLRSHVRLHRHRYRGQLWYVLQDLSSQRHHRFTPTAHFVIGLMDGSRTVGEIWDEACARLEGDAPTQDQVIQLLAQLHAADALQSDVAPDTRELLARHDRQRSAKIKGQILSPLFWRIPLFDPERILQRGIPVVRHLLSPAGAILWLAVVGSGLVLTALHWTDLSEDFIDRVLAPKNLVLIWLLFPVLKILHEFGHAFLCKRFGGEVHEMGIMMLVVTPLPYVDASSASSFPNKWQRVLVGAGGMIVELFLASIALWIWVATEPGTVRNVAYNAVFVGGVSTLFFNANPLLRFDGYYILGDLIEIPNLKQRSTAYVRWLAERYLLRNEDARRPEATRGESLWFLFYGVASFLYRIVIVVGIILFVASRFFFLGVILALWSTIAWGLLPLSKGLHALFTSPRLRRHRPRAVGVVATGSTLLLALLCLLPVPLNSRAEGVVWVPEKAIVRAGAGGFVDRIVATPGTRVERGEPLIVCSDPELEARIASLGGRVAELEAGYTAQRYTDPVEAEGLREELEHARENLGRAQQERDDLVIRAQTSGTFVAPNAEDYPGSFLARGTPVARVIDLGTLTARVVVDQDTIDLVRHRTKNVRVRLAERIGETLPAIIRREVPAASERLPSGALGIQGGGQIAVDPTQEGGVVAIEKLFQLDLELPSEVGVVNVGGRVYVRFHHGWEPVIFRAYRQVRRLFLARFDL